jgi:hypothetical protein
MAGLATETSQADLVRLTDYPKAKVSDLVTGKQRYNRDILNDVAAALNLYPYELLMPPEEAMHRRRLVEAVEQFVVVPAAALPMTFHARSPSAARPADHILIGNLNALVREANCCVQKS